MIQPVLLKIFHIKHQHEFIINNFEYIYKPKISFVFFNLAPRSKRLSGPKGLGRKKPVRTEYIKNSIKF